MIGDFALEIVVSPVGATISLPNAAPAGRLTWASRITTAQPVFYILDSTTAQEWGVGAYDPVAHTIIRPTVVMGNSAGTTAQLSQAAFGGGGSSCRCYGGVPSASMIGQVWGGNAGRNLLHNGTFQVAQRSPTFPITAAGVYSLDRWLNQGLNGSRSISQAVLADADRTAIGNDVAATALQYIFSGTGGAGDFEQLSQRGEFLRLVCGKTVTLSFWAKAATGNPKVGINLLRSFGTGGSPSANDRALTNGIPVTLSTTWTRYAVTFAVPTSIGKTFGTTGGTDFWQIEFWLSSGSTNNTIAGSINQQAATIQFWGTQLEIGPAPSPLERVEQALLAQQCLRFYQSAGGASYGYVGGGASLVVIQPLAALMRTPPSITYAFSFASNVGTPTITAYGQHLIVNATGGATGAYGMNWTFTASADL